MHIIRVATYIPFEPKVSIILSWWCGAYFLFFLIMEPWWHLVTLTSFIIRFCLSDSQNSDKIDWLNIQFSDILWHASKLCFVEWKTALLVLNTYVNQWYILRLYRMKLGISYVLSRHMFYLVYIVIYINCWDLLMQTHTHLTTLWHVTGSSWCFTHIQKRTICSKWRGLKAIISF